MHERADDLTRALIDRISRFAEIPVEAAGVADAAKTDAIQIRLLSVRPRPEARAIVRSDILSLDYLIAIRTSDPLEEHRLTAEIVFGLADQAEFEVVDEPLGDACRNLGIAASSGLIVRGTLERVREARKVPLVRFPLDARVSDIAVIQGVVLGPEEMPVAGALVSIVGIDRFVRTGPDGRFRLVGPAAGGERVRVRARGVEAEAEVRPGEPIIVNLVMES